MNKLLGIIEQTIEQHLIKCSAVCGKKDSSCEKRQFNNDQGKVLAGKFSLNKLELPYDYTAILFNYI